MDLLELETPCLLIDLDKMETNLAWMQNQAQKHGVGLRPHIKAHKIPELALQQMSLGAIGVTAAKVSEAEVMAEAGIKDIFIANQVVAQNKLRRLAALARKAKVSVGLDSLEGAKALSSVFKAEGLEVDFLIEINSGLNRCGVLPGEPALELCLAVKDLPAIRFKGLFTHAGQVYGQSSLAGVSQVSRLESQVMAETARLFGQHGLAPEVVSVGSTPTMKVWTGQPGITEIRPGNYIFHDTIQLGLGTAKLEECALSLLATVISRPEANRAVIDAGAKSLALDKGGHGQEIVKSFGLILGKQATIERLSEEHGVVALAPGESLAVGETIRIIPNHACPVINLFDRAYGIRRDRVEKEFKIAGRGKVE